MAGGPLRRPEALQGVGLCVRRGTRGGGGGSQWGNGGGHWLRTPADHPPILTPEEGAPRSTMGCQPTRRRNAFHQFGSNVTLDRVLVHKRSNVACHGGSPPQTRRLSVLASPPCSLTGQSCTKRILTAVMRRGRRGIDPNRGPVPLLSPGPNRSPPPDSQ